MICFKLSEIDMNTYYMRISVHSNSKLYDVIDDAMATGTCHFHSHILEFLPLQWNTDDERFY